MLTTRPLGEAFTIFEDPYNLAKITPSWLKFVVTSKDRVQMRKGAEITYRIKWMGVPIHWKTIITEYQPPHLFVDQQAEGPYKLWRHRHTFEAVGNRTRITDHVEYSLPFGALGVATHSLMVRKQLLGIFRYRQQQIGKLLGGDAVQILEPVVTG